MYLLLNRLCSFIFLICFYLFCCVSVSNAAEIKSEMLISGCQELIAIYDREGDKQLLAGLSTSVAEAMRAGICRGMLEEHDNHDINCHSDWYEKAVKISNSNNDQTIEQLLTSACL